MPDLTTSLAPLRVSFLSKFRDFRSFLDPGQDFRDQEDDYKREAVKLVRTSLAPYVEGGRDLASDTEASER